MATLWSLIKGAIEGTNSWADVGTKAEDLFHEDVVDPIETFAAQFASDFGKAALTEAATVVPQVLSGQLNIGEAIPQVAAALEQQGVKIAETDALQEANTVIGNAIRVQVTATQITSSGNAPAAPSAPTPDAEPQTSDTTDATASAGSADAPAAEPAADNVASTTVTAH